MGKILLSAFTDEYNKNIDTQIQIANQLGLDCIEPRFIDGKNISMLNSEEAKMLKEKLEGLRVSAIGSPLGKIKLSDDFTAHLETAKEVYETASILGTKNIRIFSFYPRQGEAIKQSKEEVLDKMGQMLVLAKEYDVVLCHENESEIYGESPDDCLELLEAFGGQLRCVFDMGNFVLGGYKPYSEAYAKLKNYIEYFHIKDALKAGAIVPPGCGEGCIKEIISSYKQDFKRDFTITLEPHLQLFDGLNALVNSVAFENPYKYETQEAAFLDAVSKMKSILKEV